MWIYLHFIRQRSTRTVHFFILSYYIILLFYPSPFFACALNLVSFQWSFPQRLSPPYHQPVRPMFVPLSLIHAIDDPASLHLGCHGLSSHLSVAMSSMTGVSLSLYHDECINASIHRCAADDHPFIVAFVLSIMACIIAYAINSRKASPCWIKEPAFKQSGDAISITLPVTRR